MLPIVIGLLAAPSAMAAELDRYVGKYPFDKVGGRTLYETPGLREDFVRKFGARRWATLMTYQTAVPVEAVEDAKLGRVIVAHQCKPHDCPTAATVFLRPAGTVIGICFTGDAGTEWSGESWNVRQRDGDCGDDAKNQVSRFNAAAARR
jgi:hypothetical protein